ncbi:MAG: polyphosphate:AMP phosphotransferase [Planctomycetota bacterium]
MLELIDLEQAISKEDYDKQFPLLEQELGECQRLARAAGVPIIVVFEGWDASGKGTVINRLAQALDPRGFKVHPTLAPNETERFHPWMWRFWNNLPAAGDWAIFDRSWYRRGLEDYLEESVNKHQVLQALEDIRQFEQELADSGAVIVKFWLHISKREQKKRFRLLLDSQATAWKIGKAERRQHRHYDAWLPAVEEMITRTNSVAAPWTIVEATQRRFARVTVFRTLIAAVREAIDSHRLPAGEEPPRVQAEVTLPPLPVDAETPAGTILDRVEVSLSLDWETYEAQRKELNERLLKAEHELYIARIPAVICYEGWDAGGKGGNIKRLTQGLDPRGYEVVPFAAPTQEEKAHNYLWRFWRCIPKAGHITIFDRTWYGRVLVERVEGFCSEADWKRAYDEINQFERQLTDFGAVIVKFWLQIDAEEQLRRFQERQNTPYKQWKITDEDWRNREKRPKYEPAVVEMLRRTSTPHAPWTILEANCKYYARIKALRTVAEALEKAVGK